MACENFSTERDAPLRRLSAKNSRRIAGTTKVVPSQRSVETAADGIADGSSDPHYIVGAEVGGVIYDVVEMRLGSDEHVSPDVVANTAADVHQKMIAAVIAGSEIDATAGGLIAVEASRLDADTTHQVEANFLAELGLIQAVEIKQNRTVRNAESGIVSLAGFPGRFKVEAYALLEDDVATDAGVQTALFRHKATTLNAVVRSWRHDGAEADHGVALLGRSETG
jgi:hypothetical protein